MDRKHPPARGPSDGVYRLAPAIVVRVAGAALVLVAVVVLLLSALSAWAGWAFWPVLVVAVVGLAAVAAGAWWAGRRAYVVRLDAAGYRVRLLRGAGVARARWVDVAEASTGEVRGMACVVLGLRDGRRTTVPMAALAGDRDAFVADVRDRLKKTR